MKTIVVLFLSAFLCNALAEPLRYRQSQPVRASARVELAPAETEGTQNDEAKSEQPTEPSFTLSAPAPGPYYPQGWRPFGQLLVLPVAVRGNLESTTTVESTTSNDETTEAATTETVSNDDTQSTNGELQEVETSEPKTKLAAHKRPPTIVIIKGKKLGQLKVESTEEESNDVQKEVATESDENESSTTEAADEATTTPGAKSEDLETTSEPDSEAVDPEKSNEEGKQAPQEGQPQPAPVGPSGFFIQLPDGSFQRIVYVAPQAPPQAPQPPTPFQQLNQAPNYSPFGFNPINNPRIVTFSTQYNAW